LRLLSFLALFKTMIQIGNHPFEWGKRTYIMGIINCTPDSFSGDGLMAAQDVIEAAVVQAHRFVAEGADILDIGGESTRPGSQPVGAEEELARVLPVIERIAQELDTVISIDTYKATVGQAALEAGAHLLNDVWAGRMDSGMVSLAAERNVPIVLMHNRSRPKDVAQETLLGGRYVGVQYDDLIHDIRTELMERVEAAQAAGVPSAHIILDPGVGFGKTVPQNLELLQRLAEIRALGYPLLLGASRKSFIGYTLDLPPDQRLEGTAATTAIGIARGADMVRVHDVQAMARVAKMTDAIVRR
jgi:dihydropteroate synthase